MSQRSASGDAIRHALAAFATRLRPDPRGRVVRQRQPHHALASAEVSTAALSARRQTNSSAGHARSPVVGRFRILAGVLFQHGVEVGSAEAERTHARRSRVSLPVYPRPRFGVEVQRAAVEVRLRVRRFHQRRRQNLVVQRERGLDQPGEPGGTCCARSSTSPSRCAHDCGSPPASRNSCPMSAGFGLVADDGAGAVRFSTSADVRRVDCGPARTPRCSARSWPSGTRGREALVAAVARSLRRP